MERAMSGMLCIGGVRNGEWVNINIDIDQIQIAGNELVAPDINAISPDQATAAIRKTSVYKRTPFCADGETIYVLAEISLKPIDVMRRLMDCYYYNDGKTT